MQSISVRRQNSSCDQCRQSKRKCSLNSTSQGTGATSSCLKCLHLGHKCTFNFVALQQAQSQKQRRTRTATARNESTTDQNDDFSLNGSRPHYSNIVSSDYSGSVGSGFRVSSKVSEPDAVTSLSAFPLTGAQIDSFGHDSMMMNHMTAEWTYLTRDDPGEEYSPSTDTNTTLHTDVVQKANEEFKPINSQNSMGLWKGSPLCLLNSSIATKLLNLSLGHIYNGMLSGIATRYLEHHCNLFAGSYKYVFESEYTGEPGRSKSGHVPWSSDESSKTSANTKTNSNYLPLWRKSNYNFRPDTLYNHTLSPEQVATQTSRVTMIGVARFLDNFGALYGNSIERETRIQDERTLTAVLQAFALQFAPSDPRSCPLESKVAGSQNPSLFGSSVKDQTTNTQIFASAWYCANDDLLNTIDNRSFVHVYAVFLFQMTVVPPECIMLKGVQKSPLELLDVALAQMEELRQLVQAYYSDLGAGSLYRFLLDSSLAIFRWYGIVRDSIASMLHDRPCYMEDPPFKVRGE